MVKIEGFDWDAANVGHILRHGVTPYEVEEVTSRPHVTIPANIVKGEERSKLLGRTASNRYLVVVLYSSAYPARRRRLGVLSDTR